MCVCVYVCVCVFRYESKRKLEREGDGEKEREQERERERERESQTDRQTDRQTDTQIIARTETPRQKFQKKLAQLQYIDIGPTSPSAYPYSTRRLAGRPLEHQLLRGHTVVETKVTLKVVRTRVKRVLMYSKVENASMYISCVGLCVHVFMNPMPS